MKSLFFTCHLLVLYGLAASVIREYYYVPQLMTWTQAQNYCKQSYGDLATITTNEEYRKAAEVTGGNLGWNGLKRTAPNVNIWQWPDGEETNLSKWSTGEPDNRNNAENCVVMNQYGWFDTSCGGNFAFICSRSFLLVKEKQTWQKALQYCKTHYSGLAFVVSENQLKYYENLFEIETEQAQTARVWTGLRFLDGKWFWVNGALLGSLVSLPQCPNHPYRCSAYNFNTSVWENRDCNEELNFLCYL